MRLYISKESDPFRNRSLGLPALIVGMIVGLTMLIFGLLAPLPPQGRWLIAGTGIFGAVYAVAFLVVVIPMGMKQPRIWWMVVIFHSLATVWLLRLDPINLPGISLLTAATLMVASAVLMGRWPAYFFVFCSLLFYHFLPTFTATTAPSSEIGIQAAALITSIVLIETIRLFQKVIQRQVSRLEVVNEMTRSLAYSIEMNQVVSLISRAIQSTLNADTYYIGLLRGDHIHLELFYDGGEFFPETSVPIHNTLVGRVVKLRDSILLSDTLRQLPQMEIPLQVIGKNQSSLSWMGAPLQMRHDVFGVAAVASYRKNAFNHSDLELLENFAHQASIALYNANHHAEVELKSTQDSLTKVLNHGFFLEALTGETRTSAGASEPLSVIMLDIDHFKRYNDNYGHLVGDQVLIRLTDLLRRYIKNSDLVGRWGGEEFAIALPSTNGVQAAMVAERIRKALRKLEFFDRDGKKIPSPTISQGIAVFPDEANSTERLIDLADQRLYIAKQRGRDQIEPVFKRNPASVIAETTSAD